MALKSPGIIIGSPNLLSFNPNAMDGSYEAVTGELRRGTFDRRWTCPC